MWGPYFRQRPVVLIGLAALRHRTRRPDRLVHKRNASGGGPPARPRAFRSVHSYVSVYVAIGTALMDVVIGRCWLGNWRANTCGEPFRDRHGGGLLGCGDRR